MTAPPMTDYPTALDQGLLDVLGVAVYTTDAAGRITMFNTAAVEAWGRTPVLGQDLWCGSWRIYRDGQPIDLEDCPMGIALREGRPVRGVEIVVERPDGTRIDVLPYPTPIFDAAGTLTGAINVLVDITEQKRLQRELEDAVQSKDDFLGQVSHELRTPLTQIEGNADLIRSRLDDLPPDVLRESVSEIHGQAVRMQHLIENMLIVSRFERGVAPETEPHLIQRLLGDCIENFTEKFPGASVLVTMDEDLPPVETNASTIDQVIWNLLTNAQKYGPPGGTIRVEARRDDGSVSTLVIDEGQGPPDEDLERIFEPYFRSEQVGEGSPGLGLGLSVCKRLVEAQGGELWARRRCQGGMEFGMRLRVAREVR